MPAFDRDAMVAVAHAHAAAEADGDIETTMRTLDDNPVYELLPMGVCLRGRELARRYYEHFFAECQPRIAGYSLRSEWVTDEALGQEYQVFLDSPEGPIRHDIIGILTFGAGDRLSGERIYASDELLRIMFGSVLDHAIPVSADGLPEGGSR